MMTSLAVEAKACALSRDDIAPRGWKLVLKEVKKILQTFAFLPKVPVHKQIHGTPMASKFNMGGGGELGRRYLKRLLGEAVIEKSWI